MKDMQNWVVAISMAVLAVMLLLVLTDPHQGPLLPPVKGGAGSTSLRS
jgi:hypothetical protein